MMIRKMMSSDLMGVSVVGQRHLATRFSCSRGKPLNVLLEANPEVRRHLSQLAASHKSRWLLALPPRSAARLLEVARLPLNRELLLLAPAPPLRLLEAFRVAAGGRVRWLHFADWRPGGQLRPQPPPLERRRADFRGAVLNVSIKNDPPYAIRNVVNGSTHFSGYFYDTWHLLSEQLNFTYRTWEQTAWGSLSAAGDWSGMTGDLTRGLADAAIASFTQTTMRNRHVDFTTPLIRTRSAVFIRERYETEPNVKWITSTFTAPLWLATGAVVLLDTVSFVAVRYLHQKFTCQNCAASVTRYLYDCSFIIFSTFCSQGPGATPSAASARCVLVWSLCAVVTVQAAFSGALVARLAASTAVLPFSGLQGFLADRTYQLAVVADSAELTNFEYATDDVRRALYLQLIAPNKGSLPHGNIEGLQRVCSSSKYAFIAKYETRMLYSKSLSCTLTEVPEASTPYYLGIGLQKGSPYRKIINEKLYKMRETGILSRTLCTYWPQQEAKSAPEFKSVSFSTMEPVLTILLAGCIMALLLLFAEKKIVRLVRDQDSYNVGHNQYNSGCV